MCVYVCVGGAGGGRDSRSGGGGNWRRGGWRAVCGWLPCALLLLSFGRIAATGVPPSDSELEGAAGGWARQEGAAQARSRSVAAGSVGGRSITCCVVDVVEGVVAARDPDELRVPHSNTVQPISTGSGHPSKEMWHYLASTASGVAASCHRAPKSRGPPGGQQGSGGVAAPLSLPRCGLGWLVLRNLHGLCLLGAAFLQLDLRVAAARVPIPNLLLPSSTPTRPPCRTQTSPSTSDTSTCLVLSAMEFH